MRDVARPAGLKVPNAETRRAMADAEEMMRQGTARFATVEELFAELTERRRRIGRPARPPPVSRVPLHGANRRLRWL